MSRLTAFVNDEYLIMAKDKCKAIDKLGIYEDLGEPHELQRKSEWISVEDRLPQHAGWHIVSVLNGAWVTIAFYHKETWQDFASCGADSRQVTHWQPLPEPPKEE